MLGLWRFAKASFQLAGRTILAALDLRRDLRDLGDPGPDALDDMVPPIARPTTSPSICGRTLDPDLIDAYSPKTTDPVHLCLRRLIAHPDVFSINMEFRESTRRYYVTFTRKGLEKTVNAKDPYSAIAMALMVAYGADA